MGIWDVGKSSVHAHPNWGYALAIFCRDISRLPMEGCYILVVPPPRPRVASAELLGSHDEDPTGEGLVTEDRRRSDPHSLRRWTSRMTRAITPCT